MEVVTSTTKSNKFFEKILAWIYNRMIIDMTELWYRAVLERQPQGSTILDVGVGTAGALLRCKDIIISKKLRIIGIDYNPFYITAAHQSIQDAGPAIAKYVHVHHCDLYDRKQLEKLLSAVDVDAVYFSGSFSLLPNPSEALKMAASILVVEDKHVIDGIREEGGDDGGETGRDGAAKNEDEDKRGGGRGGDANIYITQTYQRHSPPFLSVIKPFLKYVTTVDFGQLVREEDVLDIFKQDGVAEVLEVEEHGVLEGSVDNYWQAAYLSVLKRKTD